MSSIRSGNWKSKYVPWYRLAESVFGASVPHLSDEEIIGCVSNENWMIVPVPGERDKEEAKQAQRPNLFFELSEQRKITIGITYDKLATVERLRNIISPFNENERNEIIDKLTTLDDSFFTKVYRKTKEYYWGQAPTYEAVLAERSNRMDYERLVRIFKLVDAIMKERSMLEKEEKYKLAPVINIVNVKTNRDEGDFKEKLAKIKPIYEITLRVRTQEEFERETLHRKISEAKEEQVAFAKRVEELQEKRRQNAITAEEYRRLIEEYRERQRRRDIASEDE